MTLDGREGAVGSRPRSSGPAVGLGEPAKRRTVVRALGVVGLTGLAGCSGGPSPSRPGPLAALGSAVMYKNRGCTCCDRYAAYLTDHEVPIEVRVDEEMQLIKATYGVPSIVQSCHTIVTDEYVIEGHVPVRALLALVTDRPDVLGVALPGMPAGSPGMGGEKAGPFTVYAIDRDGNVVPFVQV